MVVLGQLSAHSIPRRVAAKKKIAKKIAKKSAKVTKSDAAKLIDARIKQLPVWQGELLARIRRQIKLAVPAVVEELKWKKPSNSMRGVPVWSQDGILCTGETYKDKVKLTFANGASLEDPAGLFNASLEGKTRRAIDIRHGDDIDAAAFQSLVRAAAAHNASGAKPKKMANVGGARTPTAKPKLLSGGNPQIAKGDGDAPVQAYIAAMPGWKCDVGRRLDALIVRTVPNVRKAVRWNTPFYGVEGQGWFVAFHCLTKYVKVAFFRGASLQPVPPVASKQQDVRYLHLCEDDRIDEKTVASWIRQAAELPGDEAF